MIEILVFIGILLVIAALCAMTQLMFGVSTDAALKSAMLEAGAIYIWVRCYKIYKKISKTKNLENIIVTLISTKEVRKIEIYSNRAVLDGVQVINFSNYGYKKPLSESEMLNCACKINLLLGKKYYIDEMGKAYGPIDSGRYETELIEPLYGQPYAVTHKVIYDGTFVVNGYSLDKEKGNSKSPIQEKWEKNNLSKKLLLAGLLVVSIIIMCLVINIINKDHRNSGNYEIVKEEAVSETPAPGESPHVEILKAIYSDNMTGRLDGHGQEDWYEYTAPVSGEYTFSLSISDKQCEYKVTIYTSNNDTVKSISTEYDGISKVTLEEGEKYKIFVRQIFAVNLSDDPCDYAIDISCPESNRKTNDLLEETENSVQASNTNKETNNVLSQKIIDDSMTGRLDGHEQEDWYEYVAPVSGEYTFTLGISDKDCEYKVTIYTSNDDTVKTISTEYNGISKVTLEEGEKYKIFVRQRFAVNLSDAPCEYVIDISY